MCKAQNNLGVIYENGRGIAQDVNQAITFYAQAIEGGLFSYVSNLWRCFQQNPKRTLKIEEVIKLCEQCIEKAEINDKKKALTILVEIYQKGIFVSQDLFKVRKYCELANALDKDDKQLQSQLNLFLPLLTY